MSHTPSAYQRQIYVDFEENRGNTVVRARAGSGKTTTIVEGLQFIPRGNRVLLCAFNKSIQKELQSRAPRGVDVRTLHSVGLYACKRAFGEVVIDENKTRLLAKSVLLGAGSPPPAPGSPPPDPEDYERLKELDEVFVPGAAAVARLVGLAKNLLVPEEDVSALEMLALEREIDDEALKPEQLARAASETLRRCAQFRATIDFDDMVWFPWRHGLRPASHDVVVVDETQDLNAAQLHLVLVTVRKGGRIVAVGDEKQAIYGFRGADSEAMARMTRELGARVLPLSITYRCPRKVVEIARQIVPDFEAAPGAPEGIVRHLRDIEAGLPEFRPGDFVLSRVNAPLMGLCIRTLARGVPACVAGRDVGKGLIDLIEKARTDDVTVMLQHVHAWARKQVERLQKLDRPGRVEVVLDKVAMLEAVSEGEDSCREVIAKIDRLFRDDDPRSRVVFSTVHKAKGLERDRVFLLAETFRPWKEDEENIYYVALTRARSELVFLGPQPTTAGRPIRPVQKAVGA